MEGLRVSSVEARYYCGDEAYDGDTSDHERCHESNRDWFAPAEWRVLSSQDSLREEQVCEI